MHRRRRATRAAASESRVRERPGELPGLADGVTGVAGDDAVAGFPAAGCTLSALAVHARTAINAGATIVRGNCPTVVDRVANVRACARDINSGRVRSVRSPAHVEVADTMRFFTTSAPRCFAASAASAHSNAIGASPAFSSGSFAGSSSPLTRFGWTDDSPAVARSTGGVPGTTAVSTRDRLAFLCVLVGPEVRLGRVGPHVLRAEGEVRAADHVQLLDTLGRIERVALRCRLRDLAFPLGRDHRVVDAVLVDVLDIDARDLVEVRRVRRRRRWRELDPCSSGRRSCATPYRSPGSRRPSCR